MIGGAPSVMVIAAVVAGRDVKPPAAITRLEVMDGRDTQGDGDGSGTGSGVMEGVMEGVAVADGAQLAQVKKILPSIPGNRAAPPGAPME